MTDLEKMKPFPRALIGKDEVVKWLCASKDGGPNVMSATLHIIVKNLVTNELFSKLVRSASKYHESTVPKNEAQAWVLLARLIMDTLMVMYQVLSVEEKNGLTIHMYGDNIPTSWAFLTRSNDVIVRNAAMKTKELLVLMSTKIPGVSF